MLTSRTCRFVCQLNWKWFFATYLRLRSSRWSGKYQTRWNHSVCCGFNWQSLYINEDGRWSAVLYLSDLPTRSACWPDAMSYGCNHKQKSRECFNRQPLCINEDGRWSVVLYLTFKTFPPDPLAGPTPWVTRATSKRVGNADNSLLWRIIVCYDSVIMITYSQTCKNTQNRLKMQIHGSPPWILNLLSSWRQLLI